jgi:hypothetical protein
MRPYSLFIVSLLLMLPFGTVGAEDHCDAILASGIWDRDDVASATLRTKEVQKTLCASSASTNTDAKNAALSIGVPIEDIPVQIGGSYSGTNSSTSNAQFCGSDAVNVLQRDDFTHLIRRASPLITAAWTTCITRAGFHA